MGFRRQTADPGHVLPAETHGLERSCSAVLQDRLRVIASGNGIEQIEAAFTGDAFSPHRHDTYAIGITLQGVQTFAYRGSRRHSLPGNIIVLHPDELHDGAAGTETGLVYRMIYVPPHLIAASSGLPPLPFVANPVVQDAEFSQGLLHWLAETDTDAGDLAADGLATLLADMLSRHADCRPAGGAGSEETQKFSAAMALCRDYLTENCDRDVGSAELEKLAGLDRYTISRHFRRAYATSPHRYLIMRRLDRARNLIRIGEGLAEAAAEAGFADQSHFSRHFKRTYGMTPGRWSMLTRLP